MPARATVFDKKCNPLLELGTGPYNTIRWNPKGKCILWLFFFLDKPVKKKKKKLISYFFRKVNSYILFQVRKQNALTIYIYLEEKKNSFYICGLNSLVL